MVSKKKDKEEKKYYDRFSERPGGVKWLTGPITEKKNKKGK